MSEPAGKIRAAIVEDEKPARQRLRRLLREHADIVIVGEAEDVAGAVALIERERPDLCFLDVQIPGGDGFEVLRRLRYVPRVIFTTAYDQYAVQAFEVASLDYLLKPFDAERFALALERARQALRQRPPAAEQALQLLLEQLRTGLPHIKELAERAAGAPRRIPARRGPRIVLLDPREILSFEAQETLVFARTRERRYLVERTLAELEADLGPAFFRAHRGYLVNLEQVAEILPEESGTFRIVLKDEARTTVPLSRRQARKLRERLPW